jgi:hypothetical protein
MTTVYRLLSAGSAMLVAVLLGGTGVLVSTGRAHADDPPMHHVKYAITAANPIWADNYYLDQEPPIFSDYSHNPYQFVPHVNADIAPGRPWVYELNLAKPDVWAMVSVSTGTEPGMPQFHCDLSVDGAVVVSKDGPKGVLCSIRNW